MEQYVFEGVKEYKLTTISCMVAIFVQAIITNIAAILFVPFMKIYGFTYVQLGTIVLINFMAQLASDIIFSNMIDKHGFKNYVIPTCIVAFIGLMIFIFAPFLFDNVFLGILVATVIFAMASGLLEVLLSPIINAIPFKNKGPAMTIMHSFYAWGQVITIIITTLFLFIFGIDKWQYIVAFWALIPIVNLFMFLKSKFPSAVSEEHRLTMKDLIFKSYFIVAFFAMLFAGATEVTMNQWTSTFMEKSLLLPKVSGDLLGMCGFAIMLGLGRVLYGKFGEKFNISKILIIGSITSCICYVFVAISPINTINIIFCCIAGICVSLLWPGTIIVAADKYPLAGTWMFAILAAGGDTGAGIGPWLTGLMVENAMVFDITKTISISSGLAIEQIAIRIGILCAIIFPIGSTISHIYLKKKKQID